MPERLLVRDAEMRLELFVGDEGRIGLEPVDVGQVSPQEHLQLEPVHEMGGIGGDGFQEAPVLLVPPELGLPVTFPGDQDGIQPDAVFLHEQVRVEAQLPVPVLHRLRDDDPEIEIHFPVPFGDVPEAGRNLGRLEHVRCDHLPVLILYGPHDQYLVPVRILHDHRIPPGLGAHGDLGQFLVVGEGHPRRHLLPPDAVQFSLGRTSGEATKGYDGRKDHPSVHLYRYLWGCTGSSSGSRMETLRANTSQLLFSTPSAVVYL